MREVYINEREKHGYCILAKMLMNKLSLGGVVEILLNLMKTNFCNFDGIQSSINNELCLMLDLALGMTIFLTSSLVLDALITTNFARNYI